MATISAPANGGRYHQSRQEREAPQDGFDPPRKVFIWTEAQMRKITIGLLITGFTLGLVVGIVLMTIVHR